MIRKAVILAVITLFLSLPAFSERLKVFSIDPSMNYDPAALIELGAVSVTSDKEGRAIKYSAPSPLDFSKYQEALFRAKKKAKEREIGFKYRSHIEKYYNRDDVIDLLVIGGSELERYKAFITNLRARRNEYVKRLNSASTVEDIEAITVDYSDITP